MVASVSQTNSFQQVSTKTTTCDKTTTVREREREREREGGSNVHYKDNWK